MYHIPFETLNRLQNEINKEEVQKKMKKNGINDARLKLLIDVIDGRVSVGYPEIWDIERYVLKYLLPEEYKSLSLGDHCYSSGYHYEYDPPKNGQNIIKHGLSFVEVESYANIFGSLQVSCPDEQDGERVVVFSDLNLQGASLMLPLANIDFSHKKYTLSITQLRGGKYRFISSRLLSKNRYKENMEQAFRNIYEENKEKKDEFFNRCVEIVERDLFESV